MGVSSFRCRVGLAAAVVCGLGCVGAAPAAPASQDAATASATDVAERLRGQMEELTDALKAAVMSGVLDDADAMAIYERAMEATKASSVLAYVSDDDAVPAAPTADPKDAVGRLMAAEPTSIRMLFRPAYGRRDLPILQTSLGLDRSQLVIAETLLDDALEAFELAAAPLREALVRYRSATINDTIAVALQEVGVRLDVAVEDARRADRADARVRLQATLERLDQEQGALRDDDRTVYEQWKQRMAGSVDDLDDRLAAIRDRTRRQLESMAERDTAIDAETVLQLARQLRTDRQQLRDDLTESLELVLTAAQRGADGARFAAVMQQIRIDRWLPVGRLGGESMSLRATLSEVQEASGRPGDDAGMRAAQSALDERGPAIAARLGRRTEATLDREIAGIAFLAARDRLAAETGQPRFEVDVRSADEVVGPYVAALERELTASVVVRDELLSSLGAMMDAVRSHPAAAGGDAPAGAGAGAVAAAEDDLHDQIRAAAWRRGFAPEMRTRWSERAIGAAFGLDDLDPEIRADLETFAIEIADALAQHRAKAVASRIERDPRAARAFIAASFGATGGKPSDDLWREVEHAGFDTIDDRVERQLRGWLTPAQFAALPVRPSMWAAWGKDAADAKGVGGDGEKSRGKGGGPDGKAKGAPRATSSGGPTATGKK